MLILPPLHLAAAAGDTAPGVRELLIILAAAGAVALVMQRLRLAIIPAYLLTGALIGPGGLGFIETPERVQAIADLALILLLFGIGLHMDLSVLRKHLSRLVISGSLAVALTFIALLPLTFVLDSRAPVAITLAMVLTMSSTAVVLRILQERRQLHHTDGRVTFSTLIIQDLAAIICLMILPPLARWNGTDLPDVLAQSTGSNLTPGAQFLLNGALAILGIGALVLVGKFLLPRILLEAARQRSGEAMIVVSTAAALGAAALTNALGLSPALGAFLGGFLLSATPFRHHLSGQIGTIRDLFAAVFFTAIGMAVAFDTVLEYLPLIVLSAAVLIVLKATVISLAIWLAGSTGNLAIRVGLTLAQAGEFGIVILSAAAHPELGLVQGDLFDQVVAIVVLSLMATPTIINLGPKLAQHIPNIKPPPWSHRPDEAATQKTQANRAAPVSVVIAGFGLVGRAVADSLTTRGATVTIVELNPTTVRTQTRLGRRVIFGDISNSEVLDSAGIHEADGLILTFPDENAVLRATNAARRINPDLVIIARLGYLAKGMAATQLGANEVVIEEIATANAMEKAAVERLGAALAGLNQETSGGND